MTTTVERYARPADIVRTLLAAASHESWGRAKEAELCERAQGLAAEGKRIRAGAEAKAASLRAEAKAAFDGHPEWTDEVEALMAAALAKAKGSAA